MRHKPTHSAEESQHEDPRQNQMITCGGHCNSEAVEAGEARRAQTDEGSVEANQGAEPGLAEGLGRLLHHLTEHISEIEAAVLNLNLVFRSGLHSSSM